MTMTMMMIMVKVAMMMMTKKDSLAGSIDKDERGDRTLVAH